MPDRLTKITIENMRSIKRLELPLNGLTVLIGDNGTGKSTILEAFEILRKCIRPGNFVSDSVNQFHGGLDLLLRQGESEMSLSIHIDGEDGPLEYQIFLGREGTIVLPREILSSPNRYGSTLLVSSGGECLWTDHVSNTPKRSDWDRQKLALPSLGREAHPAFKRMLNAIEGMDVHVPFDVRPLWIKTEQQQFTGMRFQQITESAKRLGRLGLNLPNCFHTLQARSWEEWQRIIETAALGLGDDLRNISVSPAGRGNIELNFDFGKLLQSVPASALSDGQLSYLAFLALAELGKNSSLVAFDEPESHLHPQLLVRVVWLLEELAKSCPVVLATHSDRLLDALADPSGSVALCELDKNRATRIIRPDRQALEKWMEEYRGLGSIRSEGFEAHVFQREEGEP